jgi:hypothetical protein
MVWFSRKTEVESLGRMRANKKVGKRKGSSMTDYVGGESFVAIDCILRIVEDIPRLCLLSS